jgi:hypothetical protein
VIRSTLFASRNYRPDGFAVAVLFPVSLGKRFVVTAFATVQRSVFAAAGAASAISSAPSGVHTSGFYENLE